MTTREQLEAEADELYPMADASDAVDPLRAMTHTRIAQETHVRAKTITAEQVDAAARVIMDANTTDGPLWNSLWDDLDDDLQDAFRGDARAAFRAAGFLVEGGDDEQDAE